jgi:hypothetical protein
MATSATDSVRIRTICGEETYGELERRGELVADPRRVDPDYATVYRWMTDRLNARLGTAVSTPWWGWHSWGGKRCGRPDLRSSGLTTRGERSTLIELNLAASHVLLSQFEMWVAGALKDQLLEECEADARFYCFKERRVIYPQFPGGRAPTSDEKGASWERIFDLDFGGDEWWGPREGRWIQACYPVLRLADVVSVKRFVAR